MGINSCLNVGNGSQLAGWRDTRHALDSTSPASLRRLFGRWRCALVSPTLPPSILRMHALGAPVDDRRVSALTG